MNDDTSLGKSARSVLDRNTAGEATTGLLLGLIGQAGKGDILPWDKRETLPRETGQHRRAVPSYAGTSEITGKLQPGDEIKYTRTLSKSQYLILWTILGVLLVNGLAFLSWIGWMTYIAVGADQARFADIIAIGALLILVEGNRITQSCTLGYLAAMARDPVPLIPAANYRIAILTTIVPGKEPWEMVKTTLKAMKKIRYPGTIDVWILDEGNDPLIRKESALIGVKHFSRHGEESGTPHQGLSAVSQKPVTIIPGVTAMKTSTTSWRRWTLITYRSRSSSNARSATLTTRISASSWHRRYMAGTWHTTGSRGHQQCKRISSMA